MTESLKTLCLLSFQEPGFKELHIITHKENLASQRVAQKSGFKLKQRFKRSDRYTHKMRSYADYQTSESDYRYEQTSENFRVFREFSSWEAREYTKHFKSLRSK